MAPLTFGIELECNIAKPASTTSAQNSHDSLQVQHLAGQRASCRTDELVKLQEQVAKVLRLRTGLDFSVLLLNDSNSTSSC
jgi:hypothetical protein